MTRSRKKKNISDDGTSIPAITPAPAAAVISNAAPAQEPPAAAIAPVMATQQHTIVTKFKKAVPVAENGQILTDDDDDDDDDIYDSEEADIYAEATLHDDDDDTPPHIREFIRERGSGSDRWEMVVSRMVKYHIDGRTDSQRRTLLGRIPFTEDYELEIQQRWARANTINTFLVVIKKNGKYVRGGTLPVFHCEPYQPIEGQAADSSSQAAPAAAPPVYVFPDSPAPAPAPAPAPISNLKALREFVESQRLLAEAIPGFAIGRQQQQPQAQEEPELLLLKTLAKDDDAMARIRKSAISKLLGDGAASAGDRDQWAEVAMEVVKSGQASDIISKAIEAFFRGIRPGQAPAPFPAQSQAPAPAPFPSQSQAPAPAIAQSQAPAPAPGRSYLPANLDSLPLEHQALWLALDHCARRIPPAVACQRLLMSANEINENYPAQSIDEYLAIFANMDTEIALNYASSLGDDAAQIIAMEHAAAYTAELQQRLRQKMEEAASQAAQ
ncbi:MAG: hypothetical protein BWY07_01990 [Candidatus Hydrogenedentes bacterium ADurb.Bin170]|nr:MAG: hypothetical protein BWY07_01990 [Candidatus Hydrogenedentes bacterium ADurb.Bin170]